MSEGQNGKVEPQKIQGIDGGRIKLIFGEDGDSYLLILDEDDGDRQWQSQYWKNIPPRLAWGSRLIIS